MLFIIHSREASHKNGQAMRGDRAKSQRKFQQYPDRKVKINQTSRKTSKSIEPI